MICPLSLDSVRRRRFQALRILPGRICRLEENKVA